MPAIVNYEVYVLEGTNWQLHARYPGDERKRAIEDAVNTENQTGKPAKVLRETWNPENNSGEEAIAYISPRAKQAQAQARAANRALATGNGTYRAAGGGSFTMGASQLSSRTDQKPGAKDFVLRLSMVLVSSLIIAILGTGLASLFVGQLAGMGVSIGGNLSALLFLVFVGTFLLSAVPLTMAYVPLEGLERGGAGDAADDDTAKAAADARDRDARRKADADEKAAAAKAAADAAEARSGSGGDDHGVDTEETRAARAKQDAEAQATAKVAAAAAAEAQAMLKKATSQQKDTLAQPEPDEPAASAEKDGQRDEPEPDAATLKFEQDRARMMKFLGAAVRVLRQTHPQLDAFNKFGVNLFLAGAAQVLCEKARQPRRQDLLRETIEVIGTKPKMAETFVAKLDEYMAEPRYVAMAQAGGRAMERWAAKKPDPFSELSKVMTDWNTPATKAAPPTMITIMFTDMVGSTDLTHEIGDAAAQEAVRAHNAVVRSVLGRLDGREVKHTGDGIMATFAVTANAVAAAVEIQRQITKYTLEHPEMPVRLRIGLNSGEPIAEENDYFGATVQLAARLCNQADVEQIFCSSIVRDLCAGKPFKFVSEGSVSLKGVKGQVDIYRVPWMEAPETTEVAEKADPDRSAEAEAAARAAAEREPETTEVKRAGPAPLRPLRETVEAVRPASRTPAAPPRG